MRKVALLAMAVILATLLAGCAGGEEADETPPLISGVSASDITETSATITWTTDEPATSQVEYGLTTGYGSTTTLEEELVTSHSIPLSDLNTGTTYHYRVKSQDASGNEAVSGDHTFTTAPDTTPPIISGVSVSDITPWTATIAWTTDELATSEVEYGLTTGYGSTATSLLPALVTNHSVTLSDLDPGTEYHYRGTGVLFQPGAAMAFQQPHKPHHTSGQPGQPDGTVSWQQPDTRHQPTFQPYQPDNAAS